MNEPRLPRPELGNEPPLVADRRRKPDRRQVSARWLSGTLLTGLTSTALMGIALSAAHDGRASMVMPAVRAAPTIAETADSGERGERVFATALPIERARRTIEVATAVSDGTREVIRTRPFAYVTMVLGARHNPPSDYPPFDALDVFASEDTQTATATNPLDTGELWQSKVEPDVALMFEPFDFAAAQSDGFTDIGTRDAERLVRQAAAGSLDALPIQVAAFQPFDPGRFGVASDYDSYVPGSAFRVIQENVSLARPDETAHTARYSEEIVPFREKRAIADVLLEAGYRDEDVAAAVMGFESAGSEAELDAGEVLRLGVQEADEVRHLVRLSIYRGEDHVGTVALTDAGNFEPGPEPSLSRSVAQAFDESALEAPMRETMPTIYDGIYQAALSYGLNDRLSQKLIRMLASEVDYQSRLTPRDRLTILYSLPDGEEEASEASEILFVEAEFGKSMKRYYRFFTTDDDTVDYYDEEGRSARQFLLRNPVPKGRFTSEYGSRRHPVLGYSRMHWGVDWAAPRGTPILASGAGVVEKAGWASGYGRQTVIRHANGYQTSYSHQNAIAKGVSPGARVKQGQVIGYVGSTGLSTGNHLHYELSVNGKRVDPMRVRLPTGRALDGEQLALFEVERERIHSILSTGSDEQRIARR